MNASVLQPADANRRDDMEPSAHPVSPIRVLVLIDTFIGGSGGAEQHLKMLALGLDPTRFVLRVVQLGQRHSLHAVGPIGCAQCDSMPTGRLLSLAGLRRVWQIFRLARAGHYDAIISFFESSDLIAATIGRLAGAKALISSRRDTGFRHSWRVRSAYRLIDTRFDAFIAASQAVREAMLANGAAAERINTIYNGIEPARFARADGRRIRQECGIGFDEIVLGMVANLNPVKNHAVVIESLRRCHDAGRRLHLLLAGDGKLRQELEGFARDRGLGGFVHFLGHRTDIENILAAMDIFILASRTEGLSNALLEAMAAGKTVVATRVGGNPEVVEDGVTGCLIPPNDPNALAEVVERLVASEALRVRLAQAGQRHVREHFSLVGMVQGYVSVIEQALGQRSMPPHR